MQYDTVFFDLDGTLLGLDVREFIVEYFAMIESWVVGEHPELMPENTVARLQRATRAMVENHDPNLSNREVFSREFFAGYDEDVERKVWEIFAEFYRTHFDRLRGLAEEISGAGETVHRLKSAGIQLVLATNPLFPRTAIVKRLGWAGFKPDDFVHISSYENSHFCKPHPGYYRELLEVVGARADGTLMVGNDPLEDLMASEVGITTYLVSEYLVKRPEKRGLQADHCGELSEVTSVVLPPM